jgi:hypothetical protein
MVVGLLASLAWDVETDITVASQRGGLEGLEDQQWYAVQLLASLSPWLVDDDAAWNILEESVARPPRFASTASGGSPCIAPRWRPSRSWRSRPTSTGRRRGA